MACTPLGCLGRHPSCLNQINHALLMPETACHPHCKQTHTAFSKASHTHCCSRQSTDNTLLWCYVALCLQVAGDWCSKGKSWYHHHAPVPL
jgi:hypothetical protein